MLENEFGSSKEDYCITKILEGGEYQSSAVCSLSSLVPSRLVRWLTHAVYSPVRNTVIPILATDLLG